MLNGVKVSVNNGPNRTEAVFGWLNPDPDDKKYFEAQEHGFTAGGFRPDMEVKGMFALRDARLYVTKTVLPKLVKENIARITRGR
jgi:hypothetical protein